MREGVRYLENYADVGISRTSGRSCVSRSRSTVASRSTTALPGCDCAGLPPAARGSSPARRTVKRCERIARVLSLVSTADAAGVSPAAYLTDALSKIAHGWPNSRLDELWLLKKPKLLKS